MVRFWLALLCSNVLLTAKMTSFRTDRVDVPIAGIFEAGSVSESAFSFAVYAYNKNTRNPLRLLPKLGILSRTGVSAVSVLEKFCELASDRVLAVFVGELAVDFGYERLLADVASAIQIPLFAAISVAPQARQTVAPSSAYTQHLMPSTIKALSDTLVSENWTSFSYLTTSTSGLDRLQALLTEIESDANITLSDVTAHYVGSWDGALDALFSLDAALKKREEKRLLIDTIDDGFLTLKTGDEKGSRSDTWDLMKLFSQLGMNRREYSYLFAGLNIADMDMSDYTFSGVRLAGYRLYDPERSDVKQFVADWQSWNSDSVDSALGKYAPHFYQSALMADSVNLFAQVVQCRLQQMDHQSFQEIVALLTMASNDIREAAASSNAPSASSSLLSSCYLTDKEGRRMLMYQHSSYQIRSSIDAISRLRSQIASDAGAGGWSCSRNYTGSRWDVEETKNAFFEGITGSVTFNAQRQRKPNNLVLWATNNVHGLQPMARWSESNRINYASFNASSTIDKPSTEISDPKESGLVQVWEDDFNPYVVIDRNRLKNFANQTLRIVGIISNPFLQYKEKKPGAPEFTGNDRFEGFCVDFLEEVSRIVGFKYEIHEVYDGLFGTQVGELPPEKVEVLSRKPFSNKLERRLENRRLQVWNGLIGEILNNTADLVVAPFTVNYGRARVVEFSEPFLTLGLSIIIKKPGRQKSGSFSFLNPLSNSVWLAILAACVTTGVGLYLIAKISPTEWHLKVHPTTGETHHERTLNFGNSVWISFAAFVQQGVDFAPRSPGARILASVWWFFTLIIIAYYTANLAAFLTISLRVPPINGWMDLLLSDMQYGSLKAGSTKDFFMNTKLEPFSQLGEYMKRNPGFNTDSVQQGVDRVRSSKGKYAYIMESLMNEYYNNREPCDTMMVGTPFGNSGYGIAMPRMSPMKEHLSDAVLKLRERQVLATLRKKWWIERGQCNEEDQRSASNALALINVAGVFYILVGGLLLALAVSVIELCIYLRRKRSLRQRLERIEDDPWTLQESVVQSR